MEKLKALQLITGSSDGGFTPREMCVEIVEVVQHYDRSRGRRTTYNFWRDLAETPDADLSVEEFLDEFKAFTDDYDILPPYTHLEFRDNELRVWPSIEEAVEDCQNGDLAGGEDLPDREPRKGTLFLQINERGNTSLYVSKGRGNGWDEVWAVV